MPNSTRFKQDPALVAIGDVLRAYRRVKRLSQEHLALAAGVDRSYLGRVERGDSSVTVLTLLRLCSALRVGLTEVVKAAGL